MKKAIIIIICVVVGVLLTVGGVIAVFSILNRQQVRNDELKSCSVSTGGGMLGGYSYSQLKKQKDGTVTLEVRSKGTHEEREVKTVYQLTPEALEHIKELVNEHNLYGASKRRYSKIYALDADTTSISFSYAQNAFSVSENQVMSRKMFAGFNEVIRYMSSLAAGEGVTTVEPQTATLYLKSGYTLQFKVEDAFDGKLDETLSVKREVSRFEENGIVLCADEQPDCSAAAPVTSADAATIVYDGESGQIILLYTDYAFDHDVWILARIDGYAQYACPLIAEMEGEYQLHLN